MKREFGFLFLAVLVVVFAVQMVSAVETQITVYTFVGHSAQINVLDPSSGDALQIFQTNATDSGTISVTYGSGTRTIDIRVIIRNNEGKITRNQKFDGYTTGSPLSFDMKPDPNAPKPTPVVETPVVNNTPVANATDSSDTTDSSDSNDNNKTSSGFKMPKISFKWNSDYTKYVYYTIGAIVLIVIIFFLVKFWPAIMLRMPRAPAGPVIGKSTAESYKYNTRTERQLADAERKIREAQMEIERIKHKKSAMSDAERRFNEAKRELERLRREGL